MTFVALEHAFTRHPKISSLSDSEFRAWIRLLCWCAEYHTKGRVEKVGSEVPGIDRRRLEKFVGLGLIDVQPEPPGEVAMVVHDWVEYNGTARERELAKQRKRAQRERERLNGTVGAGVGAEDDIPF